MTTNLRRAYEITCAECEKPFTAYRSDAMYCSKLCINQARYKRSTLGRSRAEARSARACIECGEEFMPQRRSDARFCSTACNKRFYYHENQARIDEWHRQWAQAHPEEAKAIKRRSAEKNRAKRRGRYAQMKADPEWVKAQQEYQRRWYQEHRETVIARTIARRAQDPYAYLYYKHGRVDWRTLFDGLWESQDGKCYLCGDALRRDLWRAVHLDHDHACCPKGRTCEKCRRGLACRDCNKLIGLARDDPDRLRRIADKLERANAAVRRRLAAPPGQGELELPV